MTPRRHIGPPRSPLAVDKMPQDASLNGGWVAAPGDQVGVGGSLGGEEIRGVGGRAREPL